MYLMTGQRKMSAKPILEYFKPLTDWLELQGNAINSENGPWSIELYVLIRLLFLFL